MIGTNNYLFLFMTIEFNVFWQTCTVYSCWLNITMLTAPLCHNKHNNIYSTAKYDSITYFLQYLNQYPVHRIKPGNTPWICCSSTAESHTLKQLKTKACFWLKHLPGWNFAHPMSSLNKSSYDVKTCLKGAFRVRLWTWRVQLWPMSCRVWLLENMNGHSVS